MGAFVVYLVKSFFCLAFFYLFNKILLGGETFHKMNRWMWLMVIPLSLLLPLCGFGMDNSDIKSISGDGIELLAGLHELPVAGADTDSSDIRIYYLAKILIYIYFTGAIFFAFRLLYNYIRLIRSVIFYNKIGKEGAKELTGIEKTVLLKLKEDKKAIGLKKRVYIVLLENNKTPFSWMNYIFIGKEDMEECGREILRHELSHIKNNHSFDIIIADIILVFQWFNPAAWLLKHSLQQVHEFQADNAVVLSGIQLKNYQLLLLKKTVGKRIFSMVNSFNYSNLKNRIVMMSKRESSKWAYIKYLYALPMAFVFISAYASPAVSSRFSIIESSYIYMDDNPGMPEIRSKIIELPKPSYVVSGKVITEYETSGVDKNNIKPENEYTGTFTKSGSDMILLEKVYVPQVDKDIAVSNGKQKDIRMKIKMDLSVGTASNDTISRVSKGILTIKKIEGDNFPLIIVDGKEAVDIMHISSEDVKNISVIKDTSANSIYGDRGKNGVIIINTKTAGKK